MTDLNWYTFLKLRVFTSAGGGKWGAAVQTFECSEQRERSRRRSKFKDFIQSSNKKKADVDECKMLISSADDQSVLSKPALCL